MYGQFVVCFVTFICLQIQLSCSTKALEPSHNIYCKPLPKVVPVRDNDGKFKGLPYFVELLQCQGSIRPDGNPHDPDVRNCVEQNWTDVHVRVGDKHIILKNHTSCKAKCVNRPEFPLDLFRRDENTCDHTCNFPQPPKKYECPPNYRWNSTNCACQCNLKKENAPPKKEFIESQCKYVCKSKKQSCPSVLTWDPNLCRCNKDPKGSSVASTGDSDNSHQGKVLAAVVVGEFLFLYLIFDFLLYSRKAGLMYYVRCKCRAKPDADPAQIQAETRRCLENGHEMNNVPLNVVVDRDGNSNVTPVPCQHVSTT